MTKKEKTKKCQEILYKTVGEILDVEDYNFMLSIFEAHQE
jgi:hypothetical protein